MRNLLLLPVFVLGVSCSIHATRPPYHDANGLRVRNTAYELERAAWSLYQDMGYVHNYARDDGREALTEARKLEGRARSFRRAVERHHWSDRRSRKDFERLVEQYRRTEQALRYAHTGRAAYRRWDRVRYWMARLELYCGGHGYYGYRYR